MQYLNTTAPAYQTLKAIFDAAGGSVQWRLDENHDIHAKYEKDGINQRVVLRKESVKEMSEEFYALVVTDCVSSDDSVVASTWRFWHEPGVFLEKKNGARIYIHHFKSYQAGRNSGIYMEPMVAVTASTFIVKTIHTCDVFYEIANEETIFQLLKRNFVNTHFPGVLAAVDAGLAMGLPSEEVFKNYHANTVAPNTDVQLGNLDLS